MGMLSSHVRRYRGSLALTYMVMVAENTFELLYPFAIGLAVNGLIVGTWSGVIVFAAISLAHTAIALARQWHGTRSFNRLYSGLATDLVEQQRAAGVPTTSIAARAALADECVDFLEDGVGTAITAGFAVVGSLVMLFIYDMTLGLVAALAAIPVALLNRRLVRRSGRIFRRVNDQSEVEVSLIDDGSAAEVRQHFGVLAGHWIRLSDTDAATWGLVDLVALGLTVFAFVRATALADEAGTIFAIIAYVWAYTGGFDQVPAVLQRMSNLADIRRRLDGADGLGATDGVTPDSVGPS